MPTELRKTVHTSAPLSKVIEFYMNPKLHVKKTHPKLVDQIKILVSENETVTWEQGFQFFGMKLHSVVKSSLDKDTNTVETQSIRGTAKGTRMTRTFKAIPSGGTEIDFIFCPNLGTFSFLLKGRAKKGFEETVEEDLNALNAMVETKTTMTT